MQPYSHQLRQKNTHGNPTSIASEPYCTGRPGQNIRVTVMTDTQSVTQEAGKGTAETITILRDVPGTAHIQYGWAMAQMQPRKQSITTVQPALSGTGSRRSTLKAPLNAPTKTDHYRKQWCPGQTWTPQKEGTGGNQRQNTKLRTN